MFTVNTLFTQHPKIVVPMLQFKQTFVFFNVSPQYSAIFTLSQNTKNVFSRFLVLCFFSGLLALVIQTGCSENATMSQPRIDQLFKFIEKTRISDDNKNTLVSAKADVQQITVSSRIINNRP